MRRVALACLLTVAALAAAAPTQAAARSLSLVDDVVTTYRFEPGRANIRVSLEIRLTTSASAEYETCGQVEFDPQDLTRSCSSRGPTFSWYELALDATAVHVTATAGGGAVQKTRIGEDADAIYYKLSFPALGSGGSRTIELGYDVPGAPPRSSDLTRVGTAYAAACVTGHGNVRGRVDVVVPAGWSWSSAADRLRASSSGSQTLTSGSIDQPDGFVDCLEASNARAFTGGAVEAAGITFDVSAWPEDRQWARDVAADIKIELPALEKLIGRAPDVSPHISVVESSALSLGNYAGGYSAERHLLIVSEQIDPSLVAHELAHMWFNSNMGDVWLAEGLASYMERAAGPGAYDECTSTGRYPGDGSPDLLDWQMAGPDATRTEVRVIQFQYEAACFLLTTEAARLGPDRLRTVFAAAFANEIAYVGRPAPEADAEATLDWRRWLDLVDERGAAEPGTDLDATQQQLARFGIAGDAATMAARSAARRAYHDLAGAAGGWRLPITIREPMAAWQFGAATARMKTAAAIVAARDSLRELLPQLGIDWSGIQKEFELASDQSTLEATLAEVRGALEGGRHVVAAQATIRSALDRDPSLAASRADLDARIERALEAVAAFNGSRAIREADDALRTIHVDPAAPTAATTQAPTATPAGPSPVRPAGIAIGVGGLVAVLLLALFTRTRRAVPAPSAPPAGWGAPPPAPGWGVAHTEQPAPGVPGSGLPFVPQPPAAGPAAADAPATPSGTPATTPPADP